jgi:hypothetical protein
MHRVNEEPQVKQRCFAFPTPFNAKSPRQLYNAHDGTMPSAKRRAITSTLDRHFGGCRIRQNKDECWF